MNSKGCRYKTFSSISFPFVMSHLACIASSMVPTPSMAIDARGPAPINSANESFLGLGSKGPPLETAIFPS